MAKKSILLSLGVLLAVGASASPLTPEQALQRVRKNGPVRVAARAKSDLKPVYTAKSVNGVSAAYVFNNAGGGFMILSADDVAYPVLGYSDKGSFDKNNIYQLHKKTKLWILHCFTTAPSNSWVR